MGRSLHKLHAGSFNTSLTSLLLDGEAADPVAVENSLQAVEIVHAASVDLYHLLRHLTRGPARWTRAVAERTSKRGVHQWRNWTRHWEAGHRDDPLTTRARSRASRAHFPEGTSSKKQTAFTPRRPRETIRARSHVRNSKGDHHDGRPRHRTAGDHGQRILKPRGRQLASETSLGVSWVRTFPTHDEDLWNWTSGPKGHFGRVEKDFRPKTSKNLRESVKNNAL